MLPCQSHLFSLPDEIAYLNGAYMSPLLKSSESAGRSGVSQKAHPYRILPSDFFEPAEQLKVALARLINCREPGRIALIPSVSYGIASAANNVELRAGDEIVVLSEQFPSNYYPWLEVAERKGAKIKIAEAPGDSKTRGQEWNLRILEAINERTAVVALAQIHWTDGTWFDLKAIRQKSRECGALLIVDATQSIGALPFDQSGIQADAVICAGYKWLLGPYGLGFAFFGPAFDHGRPLDANWINKINSENFSGLVSYQTAYRPQAARYSVGEHSRFVHIPMLQTAVEQLLAWRVEAVQQYCRQICGEAIEELTEMGCRIEESEWRAGHLFGIKTGNKFDLEEMKTIFGQRKVFVSIRGDSVRVSPNVYNTKEQLEKLVACFREAEQ